MVAYQKKIFNANLCYYALEGHERIPVIWLLSMVLALYYAVKWANQTTNKIQLTTHMYFTKYLQLSTILTTKVPQIANKPANVAF